MPVLLSRIVGDLRQFGRSLRTYNPIASTLQKEEVNIKEETVTFYGKVQ